MQTLILFDDARPWLPLMEWFLAQDGFAVRRFTTIAGTADAARESHDPVVVLNSAEPLAELEGVADAVHAANNRARIVGFHRGGGLGCPVSRCVDICVHGLNNGETVIDEMNHIFDVTPGRLLTA